MKTLANLTVIAFFVLVPVKAQDNAVNFFGGGGAAFGGGQSKALSAFGAGYDRMLTRRFELSGSLEGYRASSATYGVVELSTRFHFRPIDVSRWSPYVVGGVGAFSQDFTELESHLLIRGGAGLQFRISDHFGIRTEAVADFLRSDHIPNTPVLAGHSVIPSFRVALLWHF